MLNHRSSWLTKFIESAHILRSYLGSIRPNHTRICVVVPQTKCCCLICLILLLFDVQWFGSVFIIWRRRKTYIFICLLFEIFPFDFVPHEANNPKIPKLSSHIELANFEQAPYLTNTQIMSIASTISIG